MRIKFMLAAATAAAFCSGCAPTVYPSAFEPVPDPIHCKAGPQCEAEWSAAESAIESASFMKVRLISDYRIETYTETSAGRMHGTVMKMPAPGGGYIISATFDCYTYGHCDSAGALIRFTNMVNFAGRPFE